MIYPIVLLSSQSR